MASGQIALVREQGVNFGIVCVPDHIVDNPSERERQLRIWAMKLRLPVALLGSNCNRSYGRRDIVAWLANIDVNRLPWRQVTI